MNKTVTTLYLQAVGDIGVLGELGTASVPLVCGLGSNSMSSRRRPIAD